MTEKQSILAVNSIFPALADPTKVDPSRRVTLRQAFTWQKACPPRRVTLPNRKGDPTSYVNQTGYPSKSMPLLEGSSYLHINRPLVDRFLSYMGEFLCEVYEIIHI